MGIINILDSYIYNRIAAGEVVERPCSVVKELFENSIDAGASRIDIYITGGGIENITIIDNGRGIDLDDYDKVFLPHATSKIKMIDDLDAIATLGFRGEALSSISAVSKIELISKTLTSDIGYKGEFIDGRAVNIIPISANIGTSIYINNLFYNTPARAKFLKKAKSEEGAITTLVAKLILSNVKTKIYYYIDNKLKYAFNGLGLSHAIECVYGNEYLNNLISISSCIDKYKLNGYISTPKFSKHSKAHQQININGRIIANQTISTAIYKAYGTNLFNKMHPAYTLFLHMPLEELDINVTPNKKDARFLNPDKIFSFIYRSISDALNNHFLEDRISIINQLKEDIHNTDSNNNIDTNNEVNNFKEFSDESIENMQEKSCMSIESISNLLNYNKDINSKLCDKSSYVINSMLKDKEIINQLNDCDNNSTLNIDDNSINSNIKYDKNCDVRPTLNIDDNSINSNIKYDNCDINATTPIEKLGYINKINNNECDNNIFNSKELKKYNFKIIGQLFSTYLMIENRDKLFLVDIHAACEKILYNKIIEQYDKNEISSQPLLIPILLDLSMDEYDYILSISSDLIKLGFEIQEFGSGSIKVDSIPSVLTDINIKNFFMDIIKIKDTKLSVIMRDKIASVACKNSIKAGDSLTDEQLEYMVDKIFFNDELPLQCPHGRPTIIEITRSEIEKRFKR